MSGARAQRGAALMALVAVLVMAVLAGIVSLVNAALSQGTTARNHNAVVLQQAKTALIGHIVKEVLDLTNDTPGRFPCPESPGDAGTSLEGRAAGTCSPAFPANKTVGRLPWRTLGVDKLVDAHAEPLWYAVSPSWVLNGGPAPTINGGTVGELTVDGIGDVVAIIIAPGAPLTIAPNAAQVTAGCAARVQQRADRSHVAASTADPDFRNYLECENATATPNATFGTSVVDNATNLAINDQAVYVTAKDILNAIQGPLAERMQRTVAPLLSEHSDKWVAASGGKFLPYAVSYSAPPETNAMKCGALGVLEGMLPTALAAEPLCSSTWENFSITGTSNSITSLGCSGSPVTCQFRYYRLNSVGALLDFVLTLLGLSSLIGNVGNTGLITATIAAEAPNAVLTFRDPLAVADVSAIDDLGNILAPAVTLTPRTDGDASLSIQIPISSGTSNLCTSLVGLVCATLPGLVATPSTVTVQFPQLADASVQGTQLSASVLPTPQTMSLLAPVSADPHYWFVTNEWYRYVYYAVAPRISAAQSGAYVAVEGLPGDRHFVLALAGPAVAGQSSRPSVQVNQYLEGQNASTGDNTFAAQVFSSSGNDRIATCPFSAGASSVCN